MRLLAGAGWFCERVVVKEGPNPDAQTYYFPCSRWLDDGLDDGKTERLLELGEPPKESRESRVHCGRLKLQVWNATRC